MSVRELVSLKSGHFKSDYNNKSSSGAATPVKTSRKNSAT